MNRKASVLSASILTALVVAGAALASGFPLAEVKVGAASIDFEPAVAGGSYLLTIAGPRGFAYRQEFHGVAPSFNVWEHSLADGLYRWELWAYALPKPLVEHRDATWQGRSEAQSGGFTIRDGALVSPDAREEIATKDIVHPDDVIVGQSLCVGADCVNGESFSFDTIRLKENNLQIHFDDTSVNSFPPNDWRIVINDTTNGGASYFAVEDTTGGRRQVFRVNAGAPQNALYVSSDGDIGIRTSTPMADVHMVAGDTPALRLDQNGSAGFTPQTWDVAGNESNFFIRDPTHGSRLPFRIRPDAPTNSIFIEKNGNVGMGTDAPLAPLHVRVGAGGDFIALEAVDTWKLGQDSAGFRITRNGTGGDELHIAPDGTVTMGPGGTANLTLDTNGNLTILGQLITTGVCATGCDTLFQSAVEPIEEHAAFMWENSYLRGVGPTPEGEPLNISEKTGGLLNELEKAHIYIEQLNERLKELQARLEALEERR